MGAALRGKSTLGIPQKVAREYLGKANGGQAIPTGSAGVTAPTIATSARGYAEGGKVVDDALSRRVRAYKDQMARTRKKRAEAGAAAKTAKREAPRTTRQTRATRAGGTPAAPSGAARGRHPAPSAGRSRGAQASARPSRQLTATKPPSKPAKVTVGRDGSVTTTRRSPAGTATTKRTPVRKVRGPTGAARKTTAKQVTPRSGPEKRRGPKRQTRTRSAGGLLSRAVKRLTEMNKESVARAKAHNARD